MLNLNLQDGLEVTFAFSLSKNSSENDWWICGPTYEVFLGENGFFPFDVSEKISAFLGRGEVWFEGVRKEKKKRINIRPFVEDIDFFSGGTDRLILKMKRIGGSSPSPYRVLSVLLGISEGEARSMRIVKEGPREILPEKGLFQNQLYK